METKGSLSPLMSNTTMKSHYYGNIRPTLRHNTVIYLFILFIYFFFFANEQKNLICNFKMPSGQEFFHVQHRTALESAPKIKLNLPKYNQQ
jgi:hypothetical protein